MKAPDREWTLIDAKKEWSRKKTARVTPPVAAHESQNLALPLSRKEKIEPSTMPSV